MRFVIIGGDAAGMSAASKAKRLDPDLEVTVLEKTMDVSYSACGMPYNIADPSREMDELVVRSAEVFRERQHIDLRTGCCVEEIDPDSGVVSGHAADGSRFECAYDKLLIATGASAVLPDLPGFDLRGVMALKSLEEGRRIKDFIKTGSVKKAVIIGMGYIALEMVEALRGLDIAVDMVKPRPVFLPWLDPELAGKVAAEVQTHDAHLFAGCEIRRIERRDERLCVVCDQRDLEADLILIAVGVAPNSEIAGEAGLTLGPGNAVSVDRRLLTSRPDIYAAGDCADAVHVVTGEKTWIPLALRANRAGWAVADNVCGRPAALDGIAGTAVFRVFGLEVARTGLTETEGTAAGFTPASVTIEARSRAHAHPGASPIHVTMVGDTASGRLIGVQMVGREGVAHRINAPAVALHAHMTVSQFGQSDLAYAPPFGPVWDPLLIVANQLLRKM